MWFLVDLFRSWEKRLFGLFMECFTGRLTLSTFLYSLLYRPQPTARPRTVVLSSHRKTEFSLPWRVSWLFHSSISSLPFSLSVPVWILIYQPITVFTASNIKVQKNVTIVCIWIRDTGQSERCELGSISRQKELPMTCSSLHCRMLECRNELFR